MTSRMPKISASPSAMRAMTSPHTTPFTTWKSRRGPVSMEAGGLSGEVADDLVLPEFELLEVVVERRQHDVLQAGRGQLGQPLPHAGSGAEQVAALEMVERAMGAHHPLDARPLLAQGHRLVVGRDDMDEVQVAEDQALPWAPQLLQVTHDQLPVVQDHLVGSGRAGEPAVGALADAVEHARRDGGRVGRERRRHLAPARHPEARLGGKWRVDDHALEGVVAADVGHLLPRPQPGEDVENFIGAAAALAERHAGHLELVGVPAGTHPELEAPARQEHEGGDLLGEKHRVAKGDDEDARRELDRARAAGGEAERLQRREPRRAVQPRRRQQMLRHPEPLVAEPLRPHTELPQARARGEVEITERVARQADGEAHQISMGASTKTVYLRGLLRAASAGSTYMIELCPRISRGRIDTRMKAVGSVGEAAAYTGSRPLSNHAPPGPIMRSGWPSTRRSIVPRTRQRMPPPLCLWRRATPPSSKSTRSLRMR